MSNAAPYKIEDEGESVRIVFHEGDVVEDRTPTHERELLDLIGKYDRIEIDIRDVKSVGTVWIRWFVRMHLEADSTGKVLEVTYADESIRKVADFIGMRDELNWRQAEESGTDG